MKNINGEASSSTLVEDLASNHKQIKAYKINDKWKAKQWENRGVLAPERASQT